MEGENMTKFEKELYGDGNCSDQEDSTTTSSSLRFSSFWGLFLITGIASLSALILYLAFFLYENKDLLTESSVHGKLTSLAKVYDQRDPSSVRKKDEAVERPASMGDIMLTPCALSGPQSPLSISNRGDQEGFETVEGEGMAMDDDDDEAPGTPGREISSQNPDPPSFAEMLPERNSGSP